MESEIKFIYNKPALIIDNNILVIADLHISADEKIIPYGAEIINLTQEMFNQISKIIEEHKIKKLIILGDIKENLFEINEELKIFLLNLKEKVEVEIVKGNHDSNIEKIKGIKIHPSSGLIYTASNKTKFGLAHGHAWPDNELMLCDYLILAHQHTHLKLEDKKGKIYFEKVFLISRINEKNKKYKTINKNCKLIILPSFNPILSGRAINDSKTGLGPIFKNKVFKMNSTLIYTLKGICLGQLKRK